MSQEERDEEAEAVLEYEHMRSQGVSLQEIGAGRAKGIEKPGMVEEENTPPATSLDEKTDPKHVEQV